MDLLQYRFLCYDREADAFHLVGYPLSLSPIEHRLLLAILENGSQGFEALCALTDPPLSHGSVSVHIHGINRKATKVSGRRLVEFRDGSYRLARDM